MLSLNSTYQVTSVTFGDNSDQIISGGIDNAVKVWDLRKTNSDGSKNPIGPNHKPVHELVGHTDTITGLSISPDGKKYLLKSVDDIYLFSILRVAKLINIDLSYVIGSYVLSNAMDNTLRVWDVRPYVTTDRCVKIITGHKHNFEKVRFCAWL